VAFSKARTAWTLKERSSPSRSLGPRAVPEASWALAGLLARSELVSPSSVGHPHDFADYCCSELGSQSPVGLVVSAPVLRWALPSSSWSRVYLRMATSSYHVDYQIGYGHLGTSSVVALAFLLPSRPKPALQRMPSSQSCVCMGLIGSVASSMTNPGLLHSLGLLIVPLTQLQLVRPDRMQKIQEQQRHSLCRPCHPTLVRPSS